MEGILQGVPNVSVYLDDILVTRSTKQEHLDTLEKRLTRLGQAGIHLKCSKCDFIFSSIEYLGHRISGNGLQPHEEKVIVISKAPAP